MPMTFSGSVFSHFSITESPVGLVKIQIVGLCLGISNSGLERGPETAF